MAMKIEPPAFPAGKLVIACVDNPGQMVHAHFNPKEISLEKNVPWNRAKGDKKSDIGALEFTNAENRTMSFELLFDTYEHGVDVYAAYVATLMSFTQVPDDAPEDKKHPPLVMVTWGPQKKFIGVITSLSTKYTMFLEDGTPVRATCSLKFKETSRIKHKARRQNRGGERGGDAGGAGGAGAGGAPGAS